MSTAPVWIVSREGIEDRRPSKRPRYSQDSPQDVHNSVQATHDISRLRRWRTPEHITWEELCSFFPGPAPMLESLSLQLDKSDGEGFYRSLDGLFSGVAPPLRHLSIQHIHAGSLLLTCTNLTVLEIRNPTPQYSASTFLSVLRKLSRLVSLHVSCALQPPKNYDRDPGPTYTPLPRQTRVVKLPSLEFFSFYGLCYDQDLDFLSHFSFPSTTLLLFSSGYPFRQNTSYAAVADFLKVYASARQDSVVPKPTVIELRSEYARLKLNIRVGHRILCGLKLNSAGGDGDDQHSVPDDPSVTEMFSHLSYPTVTEFFTACYIDPLVWPIISSSLPALKHISIEELYIQYEEDTVPIFEAIIDNYQDKPSSPSFWTPIFPRLRFLSLKKVAFSEICQTSLVKALRGRQKASSGLETLKIDHCRGVQEELVDELVKIEGLSVDWFDFESENESDDSDEEPRAFDAEAYGENYNEGEALDEGEIDVPCAQSDDIRRYQVDSYIPI
ncbi:hypothetical protein BDN72DRAFT_842444 [Pluteus cervinus]|uniref:Uncharacterized protein n=1 Tax=Pluteus cervinus TaxID=181527 RepID=A0ACD3APT5_9AGAR|nr:hypothetical protein BDN72DRAFT_842444 [Pluteus cervinus]